jgi:molybdopterin/thiamine biosynthesis adenylyltransferase
VITKNNEIFVIGAGGIGTYVLSMLLEVVFADMLQALDSPEGDAATLTTLDPADLAVIKDAWNITIIDGDVFEAKNHLRQAAAVGVPKAMHLCRLLQSSPLGKLISECIHYKHTYVRGDNVHELLASKEGGTKIIFSCLDNHKSRNILSVYAKHCKSNIWMATGGNDYEYGQVFLYRKNKVGKAYVELDPAPHDMYECIREPKDKAPFEIGCGEDTGSMSQLALINNIVAMAMLNAFRLTYLNTDLAGAGGRDNRFDVSIKPADTFFIKTNSTYYKPITKPTKPTEQTVKETTA